jgi:hypothetical protein
MSGYVVECSLKALLAHRSPAGRLPQDMQIHDIGVLSEAIEMYVTPAARQVIRSLPEWSHLLRYETKAPEPQHAAKLYNHATEVRVCLQAMI